jgi:hypothetical protein
LKLLGAARKKSEELIDKLYDSGLHGPVKVRTYREVARKDYLNAAKRKMKTSKQIYKANGQQIRYLVGIWDILIPYWQPTISSLSNQGTKST